MRYSSENMSKVRNHWIDEALKRWPQATHFWMVDSDVLPNRDVLQLLLDAKEPIIGGIVRHGENAYSFMQKWVDQQPRRSGQERSFLKHITPLPVRLRRA